MPIAPVFQESDPGSASVAPGGLPAARLSGDATAETFGGGNEKVQAGIDKNTETILAIADQERDRANKLASIVISRKLSDLETAIQVDHQNGGVMMLKGQDAVNASDVATDLWKKGTDKIAPMATNPALMAFYKEREEQHRQNLNSNVQHHMASEQMKYADDETNAFLESEQHAAMLNPTDPDRPAQAIGNQVDAILKWGKINGIPSDSPVITAKIEDATSKTLVGMTQSLTASGLFEDASAFLKKNESRIFPPSARETLENSIKQGKIYATVKEVSQAADGMRLSNGQIDKTALNIYIKNLKLPPDQEYAVMSHADHLAQVDYTELVQRRAAVETDFANKLIDWQSKGVPVDQTLKLAAQSGWDDLSRSQMQAMVYKIYANPEEKFNTWIGKQNQATQTAWAQAESMVTTKYPKSTVWDIGGNKVNAQKEALAELKNAVLGKSADQIRQITEEKLKNVPNPNAFSLFGVNLWNKTKPSLYMDAAKNQMISEAYGKIEKDFNTPDHPDAVSQARAYMATHRDKDGKPFIISPANLLKFLQDNLNQKKNESPK